ncbi:MAG: cation transporter [Anaerolineae bacterium]|nr:cation transporter [Anaerolineae bacterium]
MRRDENCHVDVLEKPIDREALATAQAAFLAVRGMGCPRCATRVHNGLLQLDGVLLVEVTLEIGLAAVAYDPAQVEPPDLVHAVAEAGNDGRHRYQAEVVKLVPAMDVPALLAGSFTGEE